MSVSNDLIAAYGAALYNVDIPDGAIMTLRIGQADDACDQVLRVHNATRAALITAYNPRSRLMMAAENESAHAALREAVMRMGKAALPSRASDPAGIWPVEPGLFIIDISESDARAVALQFDQHAFVWIESGRAAALMFTE